MSRVAISALVFGVSCLVRPAFGQSAPPHEHSGQHQAVHFPISCRRAVQPSFDRAVAALHSFGYESARRGFLAVAHRDPACGMAWWGVAMSYFHQHWDQPTPAELASGRAAALKAEALGAGTERERGYIAAIGAFYRDAGRLDHRRRALAYKAAMEKLAADFPGDPEATVFYALSLLATRRHDDTTHADQKLAAGILRRLLPEHPEHPGIAHYTIHAFDSPELAELALPAARLYSRIAPESPHALHMPSHIFTRLGLWHESIASNREVVRVAAEQLRRSLPGAFAFEHLHALDYLAYAYLQLGEDGAAREVVEEVANATRFDDPNFAVGYALVSIPARYALERQDWRMAASLEMPEIDLPWKHFPYARGNVYYANALGAARTGDVERAREAVAKLSRLQGALAAAPPRGPYDWAGRVEAMRLASSGWLAYAEGRTETALQLLARGAALEAAVGKHPVTPGPLLPAREQLADLLLELGRPREALGAYEASLNAAPRRFRSLAGAARAAELAGDHERAREFYRALLTLCAASPCRRPAAGRAAAFLQRN